MKIKEWLKTTWQFCIVLLDLLPICVLVFFATGLFVDGMSWIMNLRSTEPVQFHEIVRFVLFFISVFALALWVWQMIQDFKKRIIPLFKEETK